jgi:hypothetical protein
MWLQKATYSAFLSFFPQCLWGLYIPIVAEDFWPRPRLLMLMTSSMRTLLSYSELHILSHYKFWTAMLNNKKLLFASVELVSCLSVLKNVRNPEFSRNIFEISTNSRRFQDIKLFLSLYCAIFHHLHILLTRCDNTHLTFSCNKCKQPPYII